MYRVLGISVLLLFPIHLMGCGDDESTPISMPTSPPTSTFAAQAVHASPDAPAVDVFVNGNEAFSGLTFFDVTAFATVPTGSTDIDVFVSTPGTNLPSTAPVISATVSPPANTSQTVAVGGVLNPAAGQEPLKIFAFPADVIPSSGLAEVRIIHLSPDAPPVDVRLGNQDPEGTLLTTLAYGQPTSRNLELAPGTYTVSIFASGTSTFAGGASFTVEANTNYTVYAVGLLGDGSFRLEVAQDN
ncbi:MAG: DUF4397 domain-containing protein [Synechococcaceae cyanobacterium SM2_3_1]|nr:DUF4397 domain-containing protein [Synechococcaceae cyanobacterium SM2_3_1]